MEPLCHVGETLKALERMKSQADRVWNLVEHDAGLAHRASDLRVMVRLLLYSIRWRQAAQIGRSERAPVLGHISASLGIAKDALSGTDTSLAAKAVDPYTCVQ